MLQDAAARWTAGKSRISRVLGFGYCGFAAQNPAQVDNPVAWLAADSAVGGFRLKSAS